jgi:deoxyribodipyrimidine photolyase-related protein
LPNSLGDDGIAVRYRRLDDADNAGSLAGEVAAAIAAFGPDRIVITAPGEYRLADEMAGWQARFGLAVDIRADTRFLCSLDDFAEWAEGRKSLRMEFFYRDLRRRYQVLMEGDEPIGGKWNYDADNRQPPKAGLAVPPPSSFAPDAITAEVLGPCRGSVAPIILGNWPDLILPLPAIRPCMFLINLSLNVCPFSALIKMR